MGEDLTSRILRILHLEDDRLDAELIERALKSGGLECEITRVDHQSTYLAALQKQEFDLILADFSLPGFDGPTALSLAREHAAHLPFLFVSGSIGEDVAIENIKSGATDYILKDGLARLVPSVRRALRESLERLERSRIETQLVDAEMRYKTIVEKVPAIVYRAECGQRGKWLYVSPQIETILGFTAEEWMNNPDLWFDHIHPEDRQRVLDEEERGINFPGPFD